MGVNRYELSKGHGGRACPLPPLGQGRGVGEVFAELIGDRDNRHLMLDTTLVRVRQQATGGKGEPELRGWGVPEAV